MEITFWHPAKSEAISIGHRPTSRVENVWAWRSASSGKGLGEGTEMNFDELSKRIYETIDAYFKEVM